MAKGYWIVRADIRNAAGYKAYTDVNGEVLRKYGAKFLVRAGQFEATEGTARSRNVVIEFKDYATARACYKSPEYQALIAMRSPHAEADFLIIEGYDGPQP